MPSESHSEHLSAQERRLTFSDITFGFLTAMLILATIAGLFVRTLLSRVELTNVVIQTHHVIRQLERLLTDLSDAESAALSYSLAGTEHYLPSYKTNVAAVDDDLKQLRLLVTDNEDQIRRLKTVEEAAREKRRLMDLLIALPHSSQLTVVHLHSEEALVLEGKKAMDILQTTVQNMQEEGERLLSIRVAALERSRNHTVALLLVGILITTFILGWLFLVIRLETSTRMQAQAALQHSHEQLETRVQERTAQLVSANDRLSALSRQIIQVQEDERRHIARDLHDEIGQSLTAVKLNLQEIDDMVDGAPAGPLVKDSLSVLGQLLQRVRSMALELRPSLLDELGLREASKWYVTRQGARAGLTTTFEADSPWERMSEEIEIACFRVLQESLTNIIKHARATTVSVTLKQTHDCLDLRICDNGVGFSPEEARLRALRGESTGLLGMEERLRLVGGTLTIQSARGTGTEVNAKFPLQRIDVETTALEGMTT